MEKEVTACLYFFILIEDLGYKDTKVGKEVVNKFQKLNICFYNVVVTVFNT